MRRHLSHAQVIALGFFIIILIGVMLLMLPVSTRGERSATFTEALFTATSATCVTGLVVQDTALFWSPFGQAVILVLIQVGGLGFMTIATLLFLLFRQRVGIRKREVMMESINTADNGSILPLTKEIFAGTACIELLGALLLAIRFVPRFGAAEGLWFSLFHAVSAFCNAGFDLMGGASGPYSSLTSYADDPLVNLTIMGLILLGGLGFWVWDDLWKKKWHWKRYRLHTKLVLVITGLLLFGGALLFWLFERQALQGHSPGGQILCALFDSVTPRTAGFNTTDTATLTGSSKLLTMILMFIGGNSGSTAGGIKTTTIAVLVLFTFTEMSHRRDVCVCGRRIREDTLQRAATVFFTNLLLALGTVILICGIQPTLDLTDILFESMSAIGTVGMSTGVTRELGTVSRYAIAFLMYCGRVGSMSFSLALLEKKSRPPVTQPAENIIVG